MSERISAGEAREKWESRAKKGFLNRAVVAESWEKKTKAVGDFFDRVENSLTSSEFQENLPQTSREWIMNLEDYLLVIEELIEGVYEEAFSSCKTISKNPGLRKQQIFFRFHQNVINDGDLVVWGEKSYKPFKANDRTLQIGIVGNNQWVEYRIF